jgi:hypothetical protein
MAFSFMKRRVQPLMARDTLGYQYTGDEDTSQMPVFEVEDDVIIERLVKIFKDMPPYTPYPVPEYSTAQPRQLARQVGAHNVSPRTSADRMNGRKVPLTPGDTLRFGSLGFVYTGLAESVAGRTFARLPRPNVLRGAAGCEAFVRGFSDEIIIGMLGPNPTHVCFRLATYYLTDLAFHASGAKPLAWGEFMERYTAMYSHGQPGLPDDPVTAYVNNLRATGAAPVSTMTRRTRTTRQHDTTWECNVCVASASSSSEPEPAPCHRAANTQ